MGDDGRKFVLTYPSDPNPGTPYLGTAFEVSEAYRILAEVGEAPPHVHYVESDGSIHRAVVVLSAPRGFDAEDWKTVTVAILKSAGGEVLGEASYSVDGRG